jgi:hypothetical protein
VSLALTLFFGFLSMYFFLKSRGYRRIVWTYALASVQTKAHPDIEIVFRGEPIRNLTRLLVLCWNDGTKEARSSDIPSAGRLRVSFDPRVRLLSVSVVGAAIQESAFAATIAEDHDIDVSFDFLNPGDGGLIEVLFEDVADVTPAFDFSAALIGGHPSAVRRYTPGRALWDRLFVTIAPLVIATGSLVFILRSMWKLLAPPGLPVTEFWASFVLAFVGLASSAAFWNNAVDIMAHRIPQFARAHFEPRSNPRMEPTRR